MKVSWEDHGSGPAVVYLHGVGSGKEGWRNQINITVGAGYRFIAVDAPGFGSNPLPRTPGFDAHVGTVLDVLEHLGIQQAVLCGHSLGGMTAQEFYAAYPARVSALILSATSPAFGRPDGDFQKEFLRQRFEPFDRGMEMPEFAQNFSKNLVGPAATEKALGQIIDTMSRVSVDAYRQAMQTITGFDQRANLSNISVPTLLIAGDHDQNSPSPMMQKMASKISGAKFVELSQTGHMAPIENTDNFNQVLKEFLIGCAVA